MEIIENLQHDFAMLRIMIEEKALHDMIEMLNAKKETLRKTREELIKNRKEVKECGGKQY